MVAYATSMGRLTSQEIGKLQVHWENLLPPPQKVKSKQESSHTHTNMYIYTESTHREKNLRHDLSYLSKWKNFNPKSLSVLDCLCVRQTCVKLPSHTNVDQGQLSPFLLAFAWGKGEKPRFLNLSLALFLIFALDQVFRVHCHSEQGRQTPECLEEWSCFIVL